jgi:hypothetical protein
MVETNYWRQYAPWLESTQDPAMGITSPAFQEYNLETPHGREQARSMLSMFEISMLYGICRHNYQGHGEIVDGGPLLGIGTYAMARGLAHNSQVADKRKRIYSFDLWLTAGMGDYIAGAQETTGSVFDRFLEINRDYLDQIYPSPGDIRTLTWTGRPIEILFVDLAATPELNAWVLRNWFTCLIPGESILIQQDYVNFAEWWIAVAMEYFHDCFTSIEYVYGASAVFRCVKPISPRRIEDFLQLAPEDNVSLMRDAISGAPRSVAQVLKCGLARLLMESNRVEAARVLETVQLGIKHQDPVQNFSEIAEGNLNLMRRELLR